MELWTEYEGRTIDNVFPLTKLLRPQGRSAFFLTSNGTGVPRIIRLVEPHFDEEEILARWRAVASLNHPNLLKLEKFGQVWLDGAPLLYAVMEPVDANLADVLVNQRLTLPDARQLATSLNSALEVLHSNGFVHEHVDPANVYAVGEVVKLRSDCIRECPEGREGQDLKLRDLHDFGVVLLQSLTQERTLEAATRDLPLAAPFNGIVRNAMSGKWGFSEIRTALDSPATPRVAVPEARGVGSAAAPARSVSVPVSASAEPGSLEPARTAEPGHSDLPGVSDLHRPSDLPNRSDRTARSDQPRRSDQPGRADLVDEELEEQPRFGLGAKPLLVIGLAVILVLWLGWHFLSSRPATPASTQSAGTPQVQAAATPPPTAPVPATSPAVPTATATTSPADSHEQWRVIAYTYRRQDQARHKAAVVAEAHPDLRAEVFTPTGRAPYLVSLGGAMSRDEAYALAERARHEGLPHDTYAQNYNTGRSR